MFDSVLWFQSLTNPRCILFLCLSWMAGVSGTLSQKAVMKACPKEGTGEIDKLSVQFMKDRQIEVGR